MLRDFQSVARKEFWYINRISTSYAWQKRYIRAHIQPRTLVYLSLIARKVEYTVKCVSEWNYKCVVIRMVPIDVVKLCVTVHRRNNNYVKNDYCTAWRSLRSNKSRYSSDHTLQRYFPGLSYRLLIFYRLWKLTCRLNANSLQAIKSQTPKRQRRGKIVNSLTYHHWISKCRAWIDTKKKIDWIVDL